MGFPSFCIRSGKTDPVQFKNLARGFESEVFLNVKMEVVQATFFLSGIRLGYFLLFLLGGGEWGSPRRQKGGGVRFLLTIPGGGGGLAGEGGGGGEEPGERLRGFGGGIFFQVQNANQAYEL